MLQTRYKRGKRELEKNSGEMIVETAGYIPAEIRIRSLLAAGKRLEEARAEMYDWPDGVLPDKYDIPFGRRLDTDMGEASQVALRVGERLAQQAERARARKAEEDLEKKEPPKPEEK